VQGISIKPDATEVIVGDKANKIHFFSLADQSLAKTKVGLARLPFSFHQHFSPSRPLTVPMVCKILPTPLMAP
jgi:hypothetical protein